MASSIGAAGLALATLLETATVDNTSPLYQIQVTFGPPDQYEEQEIVAIIGVTALTEISRVLGPQPNKRDEEYSLDVAIRCEKPAGTAKETWTRGWAMYQAVRAIILANQTLTGTVFTAFPNPSETSGVVRPLAEDGTDRRLPGWVIRIDMGIVCRYRAA